MSEEANLVGDFIKMAIPAISVLIGALIGGGSSYLVSKNSFRKEKEIKESQEFRSLIRDIAVNFSEYEDSSYKFIACILNENTDPSRNHLDLDEVTEKYVNSLSNYRLARATVKILDLKKVEDVLNECMDISKKVFQSHAGLRTEEVRDYYGQMQRRAHAFYEVLSSYFSINEANKK